MLMLILILYTDEVGQWQLWRSWWRRPEDVALGTDCVASLPDALAAVSSACEPVTAQHDSDDDVDDVSWVSALECIVASVPSFPEDYVEPLYRLARSRDERYERNLDTADLEQRFTELLERASFSEPDVDMAGVR